MTAQSMGWRGALRWKIGGDAGVDGGIIRRVLTRSLQVFIGEVSVEIAPGLRIVIFFRPSGA